MENRMTQITHSAIVPFTVEQLFDLVNQVDEYSKFMPYCTKSEVRARTETTMEGTLHLEYWLPSFVGWEKKELMFTTRNIWQTKERIDLELVAAASSPEIKALTGYWTFKKITGDQVEVTVDLAVTLSSTMLSLALYPISGFVAKQLMDKFTNRAKALYEPKLALTSP